MALGYKDGRLLGENKSLNELAREIHDNAVEHGWWDEPRSFGEVVALCHSELSEALEEYRAGKPALYYPCKLGGVCVDDMPYDDVECLERTPGMQETCLRKESKPEGIAVEMADCMIRILDWCGKEGIDIDAIMKLKMEYNRTRAYKHGGKRL